jgi:putative addiction module killer protein
MIEVRQTIEFQAWRGRLRDLRARAAIARRILRLQTGNFGDVKYLGDGVSELRIDFGPGYRVNLHRRGDVVVVLLCGGDKGSQSADISRARALGADLEF